MFGTAVKKSAKKKMIYEHLAKDAIQDEIKHGSLDSAELQELWVAGNIDFIKTYVETHYLGAKAQVWLMRTREIDLIKIYLTHCSPMRLFEEAEELLMQLNNRELRQIYLDRCPLRHHSLLMLFAEKDTELLKRYLCRHPEEFFSRLILGLIIEQNDESLVQLYVKLHPFVLKEEKYAETFRKLGVIR